jgi:uncharacterized protein (TIGR02246 family)
MKISGFALVLVVAPSLALISCGRPAGEEETAQQIEMGMAADMEALTAAADEMRNAYTEAFRAGDASALAALYAEDGMRLGPNEPMVKGRAAIEEAFSKLFAMPATAELTLEGVERGGSGNLAYEIGTYKVTVQPEGGAQPMEDEGKYVVLMERADDGTWKMLAQIWNSDLPAE